MPRGGSARKSKQPKASSHSSPRLPSTPKTPPISNPLPPKEESPAKRNNDVTRGKSGRAADGGKRSRKTVRSLWLRGMRMMSGEFKTDGETGVDRSSNNVGSRGHTVRPEDKESGDDFGSDAESDFSIDSEAVRVAAEEDSADHMLKQASFHAMALAFVAGMVAATWGVMQLFSSFFKPLLWALLVGAVLHRIKLVVVGAIKGWLDTLLDVEAAPQLLEPEVFSASERAANKDGLHSTRRTTIADKTPSKTAARSARSSASADHLAKTTATLPNTPLFIGVLQLIPKMLMWIDSVTIEFAKGLFELRLECWAFLLIHIITAFNIDAANLVSNTIQSDAGGWLVAMAWNMVHTYIDFIAYFETVIVKHYIPVLLLSASWWAICLFMIRNKRRAKDEIASHDGNAINTTYAFTLNSTFSWVFWGILLVIEIPIAMALLGTGSFALSCFTFTAFVGLAVSSRVNGTSGDVDGIGKAGESENWSGPDSANLNSHGACSPLFEPPPTSRKLPPATTGRKASRSSKRGSQIHIQHQQQHQQQHPRDEDMSFLNNDGDKLLEGVIAIAFSLAIGEQATVVCVLVCVTVSFINWLFGRYLQWMFSTFCWTVKNASPPMPPLIERGFNVWLRGDRAIVMTLRGSLPTTVSFFLIVGWLIVMFGGPVLVAVKVQQECSDMAIALSTQAPLVLQHEAVASWLPAEDKILEFVASNTALASEYARDYAQGLGVTHFGPDFNWTDIESGVRQVWSDLGGSSQSPFASCNASQAVSVRRYGGWDPVMISACMPGWKAALAAAAASADTVGKSVRGAPSGSTATNGESKTAGAGSNPEWQTELSTFLKAVLSLDVSTAASKVDPAMLNNLASSSTAASWLERGYQILQSNVSRASWFITLLLKNLMSNLAYILDSLVAGMLFVSGLFFFISSSTSQTYQPLTVVRFFLPLEEQRRRVYLEIDKTIGGVFATLVKVAILHFLWMWISLTLFDRASFAVTLSLLSAVAGVVPIVPAPMLALPTAVELWYFSDKIDALCFFFLHLYLWWDLAPRLYATMHSDLQYLSVSLSVVGGMMVMGFEGALLGPFALAGLVAIFNIFHGLLEGVGGHESR